MQNYLNKMREDMELRNMSHSTIDGYLRRVQVFLRDTNKEACDIGIEDVRKYIIYLKKIKNFH